MNGDEPGRPRRPHRSSRPLWPGGLPGLPHVPDGGNHAHADHEPAVCDGCEPHGPSCEECAPHDPASCPRCAGLLGGEGDPEPDLGEIVVILLVSTLAGLRDRLERDGFDSAAALVHDLVEVADDYVMRFQP